MSTLAGVQLQDKSGQTRAHFEEVADGFAAEEMTSLIQLAASASLAPIKLASLVATNTVQEEALDGERPYVHQAIRLVFDGAGHGDPVWLVPSPKDECFDEAGEVITDDGPLLPLIAFLEEWLCSPDGTVNEGLKSATYGTLTAADELVVAASRLPAGEVAGANWWKLHGMDVVARSEGA